MALERLKLNGQVAIVTGAGRGVGRGIATVLAEAGAAIVGTARTPTEVGETMAMIEKAGGKALALTGDATSQADAERIVAATVEKFGRIDILINNAGGSTYSAFLETTEESFKFHYDWNTTSAFLMSQAVIPHMVKVGKGSIVNISSGAGHFGIRGMVHYNAAKGGLEMLTKGMAQELAPKIRVNALALGSIMTPALQNTFDMDNSFRDKMLALTPLGRVGDVEDIGLAALYLCSAGCYATGATFKIDGGLQDTNLPFKLPDL
jgi:NAD(P)-dependent dehydrogenase (short-subunit alcohol dehydrogenase family)